MWKKIYAWLSKDINLAYSCFIFMFIGGIFNKPITDNDLLLAFMGLWFLIQHYNRPKEE